MDLTVLQNQRRSQEPRLMPKVKLALLSLGYRLRSSTVEELSLNKTPNQEKKDVIYVQHGLGEKFDKSATIVDRMYVVLTRLTSR